jgi:hypothetical protein
VESLETIIDSPLRNSIIKYCDRGNVISKPSLPSHLLAMINKEFKDIRSLTQLKYHNDNQNMQKRAFNSLRRSRIFLEKHHPFKSGGKYSTVYSPKASGMGGYVHNFF